MKSCTLGVWWMNGKRNLNPKQCVWHAAWSSRNVFSANFFHQMLSACVTFNSMGMLFSCCCMWNFHSDPAPTLSIDKFQLYCGKGRGTENEKISHRLTVVLVGTCYCSKLKIIVFDGNRCEYQLLPLSAYGANERGRGGGKNSQHGIGKIIIRWVCKIAADNFLAFLLF